jgi:PAS domain S-box-containing protein
MQACYRVAQLAGHICHQRAAGHAAKLRMTHAYIRKVEELGARMIKVVSQPTSHLRSMLSTAELSGRPSRPSDPVGENQSLMELARVMANSPDLLLQKLAETTLSLCRAHSAGLSLLEDSDQRTKFHWPAIAGQWAAHVNGGTPRDFGPCGTVLDRNTALLCSHPEIDFPYFGEVTPPVEEALLVPFYVKGEAVGTIWAVSHDPGHRFDAEDLRVLTNLATFAAMAYQALLSHKAAQQSVAIVESSDDAIISKSLDGIIASWNSGAKRIFGYTAQEAIGKSVTILIPAGRQNEEPEILRRVWRGDRIDHYETVRQRKDGSLIDISLTVSPVRDAQGTVIGASKIARDITERKRSEAQITILAREAEHRAKNLATVQATVQLSQSDTPEGLKRAIEGRIQALTNVHRLFVETRWAGADIQSLINDELAPYAKDERKRVQIEGPRLVLEPMTAQAIAVTLHELATNAAKYGALSVPDGHVHVEWLHEPNGRLVLYWTEKDGPPANPPKRKGFGTRAMEGLIQGQLKGEITFDWAQPGLACKISLVT